MKKIETHGEIYEKPLKNDAKNMSELLNDLTSWA